LCCILGYSGLFYQGKLFIMKSGPRDEWIR
jgi:hypothetical protein